MTTEQHQRRIAAKRESDRLLRLADRASDHYHRLCVQGAAPLTLALANQARRAAHYRYSRAWRYALYCR